MAWYHRLRNLGRTARLNEEIERELEFHRRERADALRAAGMSAAEAEREARRRLGNVEAQRERTREADVVMWADALLRDTRHAVRSLGRSPVFTVVAVASLALGIGGTTAIFTLMDAVLLRPLAVPAAEELMVVGMTDRPEAWFTNPLWEELRDRQTVFTSVAAFSEQQFNTAEGGVARRVYGVYASGDYFRLLGATPALGRLLGEGDDVRGCAPVAVLGHGYWQRELGGDAGVLGRTIPLDGVRFEIVGVARAGFGGAVVGREAQLFVPLCTAPLVSRNDAQLDARTSWWLRIMARRPASVAPAQADAALAALSPAAFEATVPPQYGVESQESYRRNRFTATPAEAGVSPLRERYAKTLVLLMAGVAVVLLIASANVANLLLARAAARRREFAIRAAIGAGRLRVMRQLMTESLALALMGAAAGLLVAVAGARALVALMASPGGVPVVLDLALNARVLGFAVAVALATALLFGLAPAWRAGRTDVYDAMRGRGTADGHSRFTLGKALVSLQIALSLVLLVAAGLLGGTLRNLLTTDPGFDADGVLVASVSLLRAGLEPDARARLAAGLLERLRETPGVSAAALTEITPISGSVWSEAIVVDGFTPADPRDAGVLFNAISPGYFETLRTRFLAGRDFAAGDVPGEQRVAVVNEAVARRFFGGSAVGATYRTRTGDALGEPVTIVGVVQEARYESLREETSATVYVPMAQSDASPQFFSLVIRSAGAAAALVPAVTDAVADAHAAATLTVTPLGEQLAGSVRQERAMAILSALFGAVALALAVLGLYGVIAYAVVRRRAEIGVRIALGADRRRVLRLVLSDVARVLALGLAAGALGAIGAGRLVDSFLFGLSATEPAVILAAAAALSIAALAAGWIPARRAAAGDPAAALRRE